MRSLTPLISATTTQDFEPHGYVHMTGEFVNGHRSEIQSVLRREADHAHRGSPAARIMAWDEDGSGGLLVTTTTEHLAHRLGRSLHKDLGGELHHGFFHNNKLAFVWWQR